jgi:hypothetical protein
MLLPFPENVAVSHVRDFLLPPWKLWIVTPWLKMLQKQAMAGWLDRKRANRVIWQIICSTKYRSRLTNAKTTT